MPYLGLYILLLIAIKLIPNGMRALVQVPIFATQ